MLGILKKSVEFIGLRHNFQVGAGALNNIKQTDGRIKF